MIHWKDLGTQGRIDAIRSVWFSGCSTAQIAANFKDATRNAIIGVYHRYGQTYLIDKPLRSQIAIGAERKSKKRLLERAPIFFRPEKVSKPLPEPVEAPTEYDLCGKPQMLLQAKECRWSVNEATGDALHLFCGRPAVGPYCSHHRLRAYRGATQ